MLPLAFVANSGTWSAILSEKENSPRSANAQSATAVITLVFE